jgi:hypothetical protein
MSGMEKAQIDELIDLLRKYELFIEKSTVKPGNKIMSGQ